MSDKKQVITCHEKHDTPIWDATTPEAFAASALAILTERWRDGYWYHDPDADGLGTSEWAEARRAEIAAALALTKEEIDKLPASARQSILGLRGQARSESEHERQHRDWYARARTCVEEQDDGLVTVGGGRWEHQIPVAWQLLEERSDHEYERVELVTLEQAEKVTP